MQKTLVHWEVQNASATSRSANLSARVSNSANLTVVSGGADSTHCHCFFYKAVTSQQLLTSPVQPRRKTSSALTSSDAVRIWDFTPSHWVLQDQSHLHTKGQQYERYERKGPRRRFVSVFLRIGIAAHLPLEGTPSLNSQISRFKIKCM